MSDEERQEMFLIPRKYWEPPAIWVLERLTNGLNWLNRKLQKYER